MKVIQDAIEKAMDATQPKTKERNRALAAVKWVLKCMTPFGVRYAGLNGMTCILVDRVNDAQVFDGRDNETMKAHFWGIQLGQKLEATLL